MMMGAAPAVAELKENWGTRRRMEALKDVDQEGVEELLDRATRIGNAPQFISQYKNQAEWIWRQWHGTVLQQTCAWLTPIIARLAVAAS